LKTGDMLGQFGPGQLFALTVFRHGDHGDGIVATAQQVFGKFRVAPGNHWALGICGPSSAPRRVAVEADIEEVDDGLPEATR
jgi:hypothetical protein